jgi:hypothetical protein
MKKFTAKVVSLVLSSALAVTSFSTNFAMAATKTMNGAINGTNADSIYLVNGGASTSANLTDYLLNHGSNFKFETIDHHEVTEEKIDTISHISGDSLVSLNVDSSTDTATIKLKSSSVSGKEVIAVLYEGSYSDDDGNDYTVKARNNLTVYVYNKDQIVFGEYDAGYATKDSGTGFDDFKTFAQTANYTKTLGVYKAEPDADSALATYLPADLTTATTGITDKNAYSFSMSGSDVHIPVTDATASTFTTFPIATVGKTLSEESGKYTQDAAAGNVTVTVKKLVADGSTYKASTASGDTYTLKTKVEKKIDAATVLPGSKVFSIKKTDGKSVLTGDATSGSSNVTDSEVVFPQGTTSVTVDENTSVKEISGHVGTLEIGDAKVGSIDIGSGTVNVTDGTVGDIKTDGAPVSGDDAVLVSGGKVGNIDVTGEDLESDSNVTVNSGTTGAISASGTVTVDATDTDNAVATGKITAQDISLSSNESNVTVAGIKASADGTITLLGDKTAVSAIDLDYRETTLNLGNDEGDAFTGKVPAPTNAVNAEIAATDEDTNATISGTVDVDTISLDTDTSVTFDGAVTVATIDGDGTMKIAAGSLYVTESAYGVTLKLTDPNFAVGTTVFKAASDAVDVDSFNTYGFTLTKSAGTAVDTFKIGSLYFAGVAINKESSSIAKGYSETFTVSAFPGGTAIPAGAQIVWDIDGSSDVFDLTSSGTSATVKVNSVDPQFPSENKATLTATLYDADGYVLDDYAVAKCELTAVATPTAVSDTNAALSVAKNASYIMKVTSATTPSVVTGTGGVFSVVLASQNGNEYFYKFTAIGAVDSATGVFLNGTKIFVATVKGIAFTSDTTMDVTVKGAYTFKITSAAAPTVTVGTPVFKLDPVSRSGNDYLYRITSTGAKGAAAGIYVNGTKVFVASVG